MHAAVGRPNSTAIEIPIPAVGLRLLNKTNSPELTKSYRAHYYAAVSWADYVAGRVLNELERLELSSSTLVVMHSDHGWYVCMHMPDSGRVTT